MKTKRRLKKKPIIILGIIIILIICLIIGIKHIIKVNNYHKTYEYKLLTLGYDMKQVKQIEKLSDSSKDYILTLAKDQIIIDIINEKYFMEKYLQEYYEYQKTSEYSLTDVIAIINTGANNEWYSNTKKTDISKNNLLITNKFYYLENTYNSDSMVKVSNQYSFGENQMLTSETYEAFKSMFNDAKKEDLTLIINSSFRSYEEQVEVYEDYKARKGEEYADTIAARPGYSEHQTGMAVDIQTYGSTGSTFETFDEFKWLSENAYKYGFILRYPKDKEYITGYDYESWHFRYVGVDIATYIHENNITFDEYYAYFVEKD